MCYFVCLNSDKLVGSPKSENVSQEELNVKWNKIIIILIPSKENQSQTYHIERGNKVKKKT